MVWRDMTEHEIATLPEARLGGSLLSIVGAAAMLCLVGASGLLASIGIAAWAGYRSVVVALGPEAWPLSVDLLARPAWRPPSAAIWPAQCDPMPIIAVAFRGPERL